MSDIKNMRVQRRRRLLLSAIGSGHDPGARGADVVNLAQWRGPGRTGSGATLIDQLQEALAAIRRAQRAIATARRLVEQARDAALEAWSAGGAQRAGYAALFDAIREQIGVFAINPGLVGTNLAAGDPLHVAIGNGAGEWLSVPGLRLDADGLSLAPAVAGWTSADDLRTAFLESGAALASLDQQAARYEAARGAVAAMIAARACKRDAAFALEEPAIRLAGLSAPGSV